ncbi:helix-turn-helix domain-containing protein [Alistipes sp.]|uniref:helix-turn-helix domain-containing protein n=1 Tax=Alistipes sp. TaxID=1872444 RepID=UPI003AEF8433
MTRTLIYFFNGAACMFFLAAFCHMLLRARKTRSRPHRLFALCLGWMALIEVKELLLSLTPTYYCEVLGAGFTLPDLFTLPLLSLFFFELVMPGRVTVRYALRLVAPFVALAAAYAARLAFHPRPVYASGGELIGSLPAYLPAVLLIYVAYAAGYCLFALARIVVYSLRYAEQIAQAYSFTERIHLRWMRWMSAVLAFYLIAYITIISLTTTTLSIVLTHVMTLCVWSLLYGCVSRYRIPEIIRDYWQPAARETVPEENADERSGRIETLRRRVAEALDEKQLFLDPCLTIVSLAQECGTNRTHLSQFFNQELGCSFRDCINRCRVEYATRLMVQQSYKAEELALLAGFGSSTTFYRAFAREKGMTPQRWQELHGSETQGGGNPRPAPTVPPDRPGPQTGLALCG